MLLIYCNAIPVYPFLTPPPPVFFEHLRGIFICLISRRQKFLSNFGTKGPPFSIFFKCLNSSRKKVFVDTGVSFIHIKLFKLDCPGEHLLKKDQQNSEVLVPL